MLEFDNRTVIQGHTVCAWQLLIHTKRGPWCVQCYGHHQCGNLNRTLVTLEWLKTEGGPKAEVCRYLGEQLEEDVGEIAVQMALGSPGYSPERWSYKTDSNSRLQLQWKWDFYYTPSPRKHQEINLFEKAQSDCSWETFPCQDSSSHNSTRPYAFFSFLLSPVLCFLSSHLRSHSSFSDHVFIF